MAQVHRMCFKPRFIAICHANHVMTLVLPHSHSSSGEKGKASKRKRKRSDTAISPVAKAVRATSISSGSARR